MISAFQKSGGLCGGRWRGAAVVLLLGAVEIACSENYRPVVQPILPPPPNPAAFHFVASLATNGSSDPGSAGRIDVSGDTYAGVFKTGVAPVHAALTPSGSKLYVANHGEDTVSASSSSTPTAATTISLAPGSQPVFVHSTENGNMYVANFGNNTVSVINAFSDVVTNTIAVGAHPVGLAETPNAQKLYVVNQGDGTVSSINTTDGSVNPPILVGGTPVWAVARSDSARIYALDNSTGTISTIITGPPDTLLSGSNASAGVGANFMAYDRTLNRLYVTNPTAGSVSVFDASSDPPIQLGSSLAIAAAPSSPCTTTPVPTSVTVLGDGSRAYVTSYQLDSGTVCAQVSVIDSGTGAITTIIPLPRAPDLSGQTGCAAARFRLFAASSGGGSTSNFKVYVSQCDAGSIAVIDTFADNSGSSPHPADVYTLSLAAPLSSFPPQQTSISAASQAAATPTLPATTTYNYTLTGGSGLQVGMNVIITGMSNSGNNGDFIISGLGAGTFTVANPLGVSATSQNGSGTVLPPQNPVFVVAGP